MKALASVIFGVVISILIPAFANANTTCGTVEVSKGDIKIQSGSTKQLAPAPAGAKICSGDTIVSGADSRAKLKMPDGNELNISPNSKIVIENYQFNPAENKKKVLLNIMQGKVRASTKQENMYNDKDKNGQANTFQVRTKSAVAGVRGTDFLTGFDPKTSKTEVVTFKGKVEFGQPGPGGSIVNSVQVGAGFKTEAAAGQPPVAPAAVPSAELDRANSETKADVSNNQSAAPDDSKSEAKQAEEKKSEEPKQEEPKKTASTEDKKSDDARKEEPKKEEPKKTAGSEEKKSQGDSRRSEQGSQQQAQRPAANDSGSASGPTTAGGTTTGGTTGPATGAAGTTGTSGATSPTGTAGTASPTTTVTSPDTAIRAPATSVPPPTMINTTELTGGTGFAGPVLPTTTTMPTVYVPPPPPIIQPVVPVCDLCNQVIQNTPTRLNISIQVPTTTN